MGNCLGRRSSRPGSGESSGSNTHPHGKYTIQWVTLETVSNTFYCSSFSVSLGKNQPLKNERPKWKSDVPLTEGQLRSKRDEFWDTAPCFEAISLNLNSVCFHLLTDGFLFQGRKEIWDALKAAAFAAETNDYALAQAIVSGANISLPNGSFRHSSVLIIVLNVLSI